MIANKPSASARGTLMVLHYDPNIGKELCLSSPVFTSASSGEYSIQIPECISLIKPVPGCMDTTAENYNPLANVADKSCTYKKPEKVKPVKEPKPVKEKPVKKEKVKKEKVKKERPVQEEKPKKEKAKSEWAGKDEDYWRSWVEDVKIGLSKTKTLDELGARKAIMREPYKELKAAQPEMAEEILKNIKALEETLKKEG